MKKRVLKVLGIVFVIVFCATAFTACGKEHKHEYGKLQEEILPLARKTV